MLPDVTESLEAQELIYEYVLCTGHLTVESVRYKPDSSMIVNAQSTTSLVVPWLKPHQPGAGLVRVGEGLKGVCRTPAPWHVFVAIIRAHQDLPVLVMEAPITPLRRLLLVRLFFPISG